MVEHTDLFGVREGGWGGSPDLADKAERGKIIANLEATGQAVGRTLNKRRTYDLGSPLLRVLGRLYRAGVSAR
jgi:hypothetical protein